MASYELNKKLSIAPGNGFIFNQLNKLKIKFFSNISHLTFLSQTLYSNDAPLLFPKNFTKS